jgi:hypothetical protein
VPVRLDVQLDELFGALAGEAFGLLQSARSSIPTSATYLTSPDQLNPIGTGGILLVQHVVAKCLKIVLSRLVFSVRRRGLRSPQ